MGNGESESGKACTAVIRIRILINAGCRRLSFCLRTYFPVSLSLASTRTLQICLNLSKSREMASAEVEERWQAKRSTVSKRNKYMLNNPLMSDVKFAFPTTGHQSVCDTGYHASVI